MGQHVYIERKKPLMTTGKDGKPVPLLRHEDLMLWFTQRDTRFVNSVNGWKAGSRIEGEILSPERPWGWRVHVKDHQILKQAASEPSCGFPTMTIVNDDGEKSEQPFGRLLEDFVTAILEPLTEEPEEFAAEPTRTETRRASKRPKREPRRPRRK